MASILAMLAAQNELQDETFGYDFSKMSDGERAEFVRWNMLALQNELHEMLDEVGWKPWASSRHLNTEAYLGEAVDAWHFFMNLLLVTGIRPEALAEEFTRRYFAKREVNVKRQEDGYDGVSGKCAGCARDLAEAPTTEMFDAGQNLYLTLCVCGETVQTRVP